MSCNKFTAVTLSIIAIGVITSCSSGTEVMTPDAENGESSKDSGAESEEIDTPEDVLEDIQEEISTSDPSSFPTVHGTPEVENFEHSLCYYFCHFSFHCANDFGGKSECYNTCHTMIADGKTANVACYVANCMNKDTCMEPIEIPKACDALCEKADNCPALAVLGMTPTPDLCRVTCAGRAQAIPSFADALECMVEPLKECNLDDALKCLADGATFCPLLCLEVTGDSNNNKEIDPNCPWNSVYPTKEACFEDCNSMDVADAYRAMKCFEKFECETTMDCIEDTAPPCGAYVDEISQHCPATAFWPPSHSLVKSACAGVFREEFEGWPDNLDFLPQCLETISCDVQNELVCMKPLNPLCDSICKAADECNIIGYSACQNGCSSISDPAVIKLLEECAISGSCSLLTECINEAKGSGGEDHEAPTDVCTSWCDTATECALQSESPRSICISNCDGQLNNQNVSSIWQLACHSVAGCDGFKSCQEQALNINSLCFEYCNQSQACHHVIETNDGGLSACIAFCSGVMHMHQTDVLTSDPETVECIVNNMDHDCLLSDLSACQL